MARWAATKTLADSRTCDRGTLGTAEQPGDVRLAVPRRKIRTGVADRSAHVPVGLGDHQDGAEPAVAAELDHALAALTVACDLCGPEVQVLEQEAAASHYLKVRGQ